jgi:hypothetical protein
MLKAAILRLKHSISKVKTDLASQSSRTNYERSSGHGRL